MRLVYKFQIGEDTRLHDMCRISKNLYNQALYLVKEELRTNNHWLSYYDLVERMPSVKNLDGEVNYRLLKAQVSQQCLKLLSKDVTSYVKSIKAYSVDKSKFNGMPRFPKYKKDVNLLIYPNQSCQIKKGFVVLSKDIKIRIPQYEKYADKLKCFHQVRIIPKFNKTFSVEIVYNCDSEINDNLDHDKYSSIDLGIDNLATMVLPEMKPLLFSGKIIKSKNQYFNKTTSSLKSKLTNGQRSSKKIKGLFMKRENQLNDFFHKVSRKIVNLLVEHKVGNLVIGYNKGWKDSINIGKRNNQTFVQIPYDKLISFLKYKCEMIGINFILNEESYTSKCDALVLEPIGKHESYLGKRIKRGLFQSSIGKLINADVNGSLNILRKVIGDSYVSGIINSGWLFQPTRVNILC